MYKGEGGTCFRRAVTEAKFFSLRGRCLRLVGAKGCAESFEIFRLEMVGVS